MSPFLWKATCMAKSVSPARTLALQWLHRCLSEGDTLLDAMNERPSGLDPRDLSLAREIASGTCRTLGPVRFYLKAAAPRWENFPPMVQRCLEMSIYQLRDLDRVPAYAVISDAVQLVRINRFGGLTKAVNGILRTVDRNPSIAATPETGGASVHQMAVEFSHPEWLVVRWNALWGDKATRALCQFNTTRAPLSLRLRPPVEASLQELSRQEIPFERDERFPDRVCVPPDTDWNPGWFSSPHWSIQDGAAMLVVKAMGVQPGMQVWDVCAAPGGKSLAMADVLQGNGHVLATDRSSQRLTRLDERIADLGISGITTQTLDALKPKGLPDTHFDLVLIDVPCSGWGTFRKHPDLRWRLKRDDSRRLAKQALVFLQNVCKTVKPGGCLVYSTCTLSPEENQSVVESFLARNNQFETKSIRDEVPPAFLEAVTKEGWLEVHPARWALDGAFAARLQRKPGT